MKLKDLFLGVCIAALLVSEIFLFVANQQKNAALDKMNAAQHDADQARADLAQLKATTDAQVSDDTRLRAENLSLTRALSTLQTQITTLSNANVVLSLQLGNAQQTAQQQQEQMQQIQYDAEQAQATSERNACMNNLREIDAAKTEWAQDAGKTTGDTPTEQDLLPYLTGGIFPVCPSGGVYTIGAIGTPPSCSIHGPLTAQ
ncbi:MAG TPA: hypothetical protein VMH30_12160 [Verrucomicrobiae bacterium]|nr:hypothetical protein [Verrucomicrobiae bacterium]